MKKLFLVFAVAAVFAACAPKATEEAVVEEVDAVEEVVVEEDAAEEVVEEVVVEDAE